MSTDEEIAKPDQLKLVVQAYRQLEEIDWSAWEESNSVTGMLAVSPENLELAARLQNLNLADMPIAPSRVTNAERFEITLVPPRSGEAFFARSLDSMLKELIASKSKAPASFFLASPAGELEPAPEKAAKGYLHPDDKVPPELVAHYLQALQLVELLRDVRNYEDQSRGEVTFIFFFLGNLELPIDYSAADLCPLRQLERLRRLLLSEAHRDQMRDILKSALREILNSVEVKRRFAEALHRFSELFQRFEENYELFISAFSFTKIREQVEEHRLEYTAKLNGVFAGIQDKLLAIPVALVIAASQMKHKGGLTLENSGVLVGALVFAGLMILLLRNQRDTLQVIHKEIQRENGKLEAEYREIRVKLADAFSSLENRYRHQERLLKLVWILVWVAVLFPSAVFLHYTFTPAPSSPAPPPSLVPATKLKIAEARADQVPSEPMDAGPASMIRRSAEGRRQLPYPLPRNRRLGSMRAFLRYLARSSTSFTVTLSSLAASWKRIRAARASPWRFSDSKTACSSSASWRSSVVRRAFR